MILYFYVFYGCDCWRWSLGGFWFKHDQKTESIKHERMKRVDSKTSDKMQRFVSVVPRTPR